MQLGRWKRLMMMAGVAAATAALAPTAEAAPIRGVVPYSVVMCTWNDAPTPRYSMAYYRNFLTEAGRGMNGMADFWRDMSGGGISLHEMTLNGWYRIPRDYRWTASVRRNRDADIDDCLAAAARGGFRTPSWKRIIVVTSGLPGSGTDSRGRVILDDNAMWPAWTGHEMGHSLGLPDSRGTDRPFLNPSWGGNGGYQDQYDLMGVWSPPFSAMRGIFGPIGPGLNAHFLDQLGWIPGDAIFNAGADYARTRTFNLAALYRTGASGYRLIRVPFDPRDPFRYYTVELRLPEGWDAGHPGPRMLIHEVRNGLPFLLTEPGTTNPRQNYIDTFNDVEIRLDSLNRATGTARVTITTGIADRCLAAYEWRLARPSDHVCVSSAIRAQTAADNAATPSRRLPGLTTCRSPYVWRAAFPGDNACVGAATPRQAALDNAASASRKNPARSVWGPNTCRVGYVWRNADNRDYVCVTPATAAQAAADNRAAASRRRGSGCITNHEWRLAWPGDHVCVPTATRGRTKDDNAATGRYAQP